MSKIYDNLNTVRKETNSSLSAIIGVNSRNFEGFYQALKGFFDKIYFNEDANTITLNQVKTNNTLRSDGTIEVGLAGQVSSIVLSSSGNITGLNLNVSVATLNKNRFTPYTNFATAGLPGELVYSDGSDKDEGVYYFNSQLGWTNISNSGSNSGGTGGPTYSFVNGLTLAGGVVKLGGALTGVTSITQANNIFQIQNSGGALTFRLNPSAGLYQIGDISSIVSNTSLSINATTNTISSFGKHLWPSYAAGTVTGTAKSTLAVDATGNVIQVAVPTRTANKAVVVAETPTTLFKGAHGTLQLNDKFYIGARYADENSSYSNVTVFDNPSDLTQFSTVMFDLGTDNYANFIESMCYDSVHNQIYCVASGVADGSPLRIVRFSPTDINDYTVVFSNNSYDMGQSPAIVTDGTYVYGITYTWEAAIFKIRISDWTLISYTAIPNAGSGSNGDYGHAAKLYKYLDRTEIYFTTAFSNKFLKVIASTMAVTVLDLAPYLTIPTDDFVFQYSDETGGYCYIGGETGNGVMVDTAAMDATPFTSLPTFGMFTDGTDLYNLVNTGGIQVFPGFDTDNPVFYETPGLIPNEFFYTSTGSKFFTNWYSEFTNSKLVKFVLTTGQVSDQTITGKLTVNYDIESLTKVKAPAGQFDALQFKKTGIIDEAEAPGTKAQIIYNPSIEKFRVNEQGTWYNLRPGLQDSLIVDNQMKQDNTISMNGHNFEFLSGNRLSFNVNSIVLPRISTTSRDSLDITFEGMSIYNSTLHNLQVYNGTAWQSALNNVNRIDALSSLSSVNHNFYDTVIVKNVGTYYHSSSALTDNGFTTIAASSGGFWVLQNSANQKPTRQTEVVELTRVYPGVVSGSLESVTTNGALATATITKVGNFDQFAVTGGDHTSYIQFNKLSTQDNRVVLKARIKCISVGATTPYIGIGFRGLNLTHDTTGTIWYSQMIVNLLTKSVLHRNGTGGTNVCTVTSSSGTLAANGDTLELTLWYDYATSQIRLTVVNVDTSEFTSAFRTVNTNALNIQTRLLNLILTDGTYLVYDYKALSSVPKEPLLGVMGDSYACGNNLATNTVAHYLVSQALPEKDVVCVAGNGAYQISMAQYQLQDILKLRPKYVLLFQILNVYWGFFDDGDANQTEFDTNMNKILNGITSYGGIPILVKWQTTGGYVNGNSAAWNTKVTSIQTSYPTTLILDLSGQALQLNDASHPNAADNVKISKQIVELLKTQGAV